MKRVCRETLCFINTITENKLKTPKPIFKDYCARKVHENTKRLKTTTCTIEFEAVKSFIEN